MTNKRCIVYETLGEVKNLQVSEAAAPHGMMRLEGVFGVCGVKNQNNRVYDKANYTKMVESLQKVIKESGCPGELEHPNSMNINLENVSHKIEDIQMNEDGTITGTILLLNTPKGQIAQAIVEGGLPLYISSRGSGTITNEGKVTLSTIKTYDLVGTPGFSQAKLTLKQNQTLECLNESLEEGNVMYAIVEGEEDSKDPKDEEPKGEEPKDDKSSDSKDDKNDKKDDNKNNNDKVDMNDLKEAIEKLADKVTSLEAQLHVAKESLQEVNSIKPINYDAIQQWVTEEFMPKVKAEIVTLNEEEIDELVERRVNNAITSISEGIENWAVNEFGSKIQKWVTEEFAADVQNWVTEEFAAEIQCWITEEYSAEIQNWITEEYSADVQNWIYEEYSTEVQNWITEEYSGEVQNWIAEEYSTELQNWVAEEFAPVVEGWISEEFAEDHVKKINESVSAFMESTKAGRLDEIDGILETLSQSSNTDVQKIVAEEKANMKYKGIYVVENMPAEYTPSWELLSEARQQEIIRSAKMYDFTKAGVLESFWANVDFNKTEQKQVVNESVNPVSNYQMGIITKMKALRGLNV